MVKVEVKKPEVKNPKVKTIKHCKNNDTMMKYMRIDNSISLKGHNIAVLKSALQKYCRRKNLSNIYWVVKEIYLFLQLATDEKKKTGNAIVSNLINRFIVIMNEEMLFTEVSRYLLCMHYIEKFNASYREDMRYLLAIAKIIQTSRICRRNSYCRAFWGDKEYNDLDDVTSKEKMFTNFVELFNCKNEECFYWLFRLFNGNFLSETVRFRRKEYIYVIWEHLFSLDIVKNQSNVKKVLKLRLEEFYKKNRKERFMFLTSAVDICMFYSGDEDISYDDLKLEFDKKLDEYEKKVNLNLHLPLVLDDYVYDKHTKEGKASGKTTRDFKEVGCLVFQEDEQYLRLDWKDFYVNFIRPEDKNPRKKDKNPRKKDKMINVLKRLCEKGGSVRFNLSDIDICENRRVGGKAPCFEYPRGSGQIYKEGRASMGYNIDYCLFQMIKKIFGLNAIEMKLIQSDQCLKNTHNGYVLENTQTVYTCMEKIEGEMLEKRKKELETNDVMMFDYCKIGIVRGIFGMSDFNPRNVFVAHDDALISLDEHDMGGKRTSFFNNKSKICLKFLKKHEDVLHRLCMEIKSVDFENCRKLMYEYGIEEDTVRKIQENFDNVAQILKAEIETKI